LTAAEHDTMARRSRLMSWALGLVIAAFAAAALHGIASYWQWGHNGYNSAAFMQAARNSLRFGMLAQATTHTGVLPPEAAELYTHHPPLLHLHLIALVAAFGDAEWIGRLVPATYSVLSLVMLIAFVRRFGSPSQTLATAIAFVLIPLNLIYANMIDHEQGSIFWILAFTYAYFRYREQPSRRWLLIALACVVCAVQFDYPGYYMAYFVATDAVTTALGARREGRSARPLLAFAVWLSAVVLLNVAAFAAMIFLARGDFQDMAGAFSHRASLPVGYLPTLWRRAIDLFGPHYLLALAVYLASLLLRRRTVVDRIAVYFLLAQVIHSLMFPGAGYLHAYWVYHLTPTLAIAMGTLIAAAWDWLRRPGPARGLRTGVAVAGCLAGLAYGARFAWVQWHWGLATGGATYYEPYDRQHVDTRFARELGRRFEREGTIVRLPGDHRWRIEWLYYLDMPHEPMNGLALRRDARGRRPLLVFELGAVGDLRALRSGRVRPYHVSVYERRFAVVDLGRRDGSFEAWRLSTRPAPWWWRWLVSRFDPPASWEPDPETGRDFLGGAARGLRDTPFHGGRGGRAIAWNCPRGMQLHGLDLFWDEVTGLHAYEPSCRGDGRQVRGPRFGRTTGARHVALRCPQGEHVVGLAGHAQHTVERLGLICGVPDGTGRRPSQRVGTYGGLPFEVGCPPSMVVAGVRGRVGDRVDAIAVACEEMLP
jgi:hypothetical protein